MIGERRCRKMMNRTMKAVMMFALTVSMVAAGAGFWLMKTESGNQAASRLMTSSVELLMAVIHVRVDACRMFAI